MRRQGTVQMIHVIVVRLVYELQELGVELFEAYCKPK